MICPKCQKEVNDNAKFCTKCGCNLAEEIAKQAVKPAPAAQPQMTCKKCGASIKPGMRFCTKCGCKLAEETKKQDVKTETTEVPQQVCVKCGASIVPGTKFCTKCGTPVSAVRQTSASTVPTPVPTVQPTPVSEVKQPPVSEVKPSQVSEVQPTPVPQAAANSSKNKTEKPKKKSGKGAVIAIIVFFILLFAGGAAVGYLVYNGTIELPVFANKDNMEDGEPVEDSETSEADSTETLAAEEMPSVDADTLFAEADALLAEGKEKITIDAEIINGMDVIDNVIHQFVEKAEEVGDIDIAQERIADAYASYVSAAISYKDLLNGQALSGNIYSQILSEMKKAEDLADELHSKGFSVEVSSLEEAKKEFISQYTDRMIAAFDEFTEREMWSRTESWNLMADADQMFDASELDNPIRLRYAYALSWWIQKQIETELNNGTITQKGAAIKIANSIKDMDYNPMMIHYYIFYMNEAGEDCSEVETAYNNIVEHIYDTQGIQIGADFDLEHFWYFNDFGDYSVDDTNGVTNENRQWIRNYMENVDFVKN